jgi:hypothetical protein
MCVTAIYMCASVLVPESAHDCGRRGGSVTKRAISAARAVGGIFAVRQLAPIHVGALKYLPAGEPESLVGYGPTRCGYKLDESMRRKRTVQF